MAYSDLPISTPLLPKSKTPTSESESPTTTPSYNSNSPTPTPFGPHYHRSLAVLSGHSGSISCLTLCGEFLLSASHGADIIAWQLHPHLRPLTKFGHGDGSVKSLLAVGNRVFSAHQDSRIRVWKLSRSSENIFKLLATLPTPKDYLSNFMKHSNYIQTRRNHRRLWIQHADTISCLAVSNGLIYSGSWDKTLKVWRVSDLKCLESIEAHDDAINGLVATKGSLYSASADGKIKVWGREGDSRHCLKACLGGGHNRDVSWNSVIVCNEGKLVYGGGSDGRIMGWDVSNSSNSNNFEFQQSSQSFEDGNQQSNQFLQDGNQQSNRSPNHGNQQSKGESWRVVCDVKAHEMAVLCLCSAGEFVCSGSADKSIGLWRRDDEGGGKLRRVGVIRGHEAPVKCLQASESGGVGKGFMLYSGGLDKRLRVWWVPKELEEGEEGGGMERFIMLR